MIKTKNMRNKLIKFIEKYGMWLFAIWILIVMILVVTNVKGQTVENVRIELNKYDIKNRS